MFENIMFVIGIFFGAVLVGGALVAGIAYLAGA